MSHGLKMSKNTISSLDKLINERRSIRKYKTEMPPEDWIISMIHCATRAPSPVNSQPVRFIRISSPEMKEKLYEAMVSGRQKMLKSLETQGKPKRLRNWINSYWRFAEFMFKAPVLLAVGTVLSTQSFSERLFEAGLIEKNARSSTDVDITVGLALKGFLFKGEELGLGSCILTAPLVFISNIEEILGIKDIRIKCLVTAGFPDEEPRLLERKSVEEVYVKG